MKAKFFDRFGSYIIILGLLGALILAVYLGIFSSAKPCGYTSPERGVGWKCRCFGAIDIESYPDIERYYCTGLNFSNNKLSPLFNDGESIDLNLFEERDESV